jgi:quercetin dioxygenase-like cupin family protein
MAAQGGRGAGRRGQGELSPVPATLFVPGADLPWFPFLSEAVQIKLCNVNRATGELALILRVEAGAGLGTHYYHGTAATYTVKGRWRHRELGWVSGPGDVMIAPAGSMHAMETVGDDPVEAFVHIKGAIEFRDEEGRTLCIENAETLHGRYLAHCALHGIEIRDVAQ